ncbi:E3 ubiquitin-protein ligase Ubr3-like [Spodoptera litura]|uniref:E3 ubiquitin-protein ligase n=1 Tax=Spodoptera litura TaxID=69820 RepID=A0A9J7EY10_SPOLT|nr:E3 ubiquitin-protein ligase Ubr3-like [Spodoptera litura]
MTYIQANFCNSMVDMDIYWLQVCAAHLPADQFLDMCIDMFGCREWLSMMPMSPAQAAEQDAMVEGLLTFLAILVSSRTNLGNDELTQSRLEVSTLLAAGDKTHSQLLELMPERSGNAHTRNFETVLKELSTYRPPPKGSENLEQGLFVPKPIVWEQYYDPLHVLRRAVHRRDFHASMERFTTYVREKQKSEGTPESTSRASGVLWPPLRGAGPVAGGAGGAGDVSTTTEWSISRDVWETLDQDQQLLCIVHVVCHGVCVVYLYRCADMSGSEWSVSVRGAAGALAAPALQAALPAAPAPSHARPSTSNQVQLHTQSEDTIPVNESIISLLLKLHSQLSGRLDSFSLDEPAPDTQEPIGDGPYFIGGVLRKLAALDARCGAAIAHVRHSLWPHQRERQAEQRARERREKEERSRRARERQAQVMRDFQRRQQQFMSSMHGLDEPGAMDWDEDALPKDYDCVICNTTAPTTPADPIGLVVLLQSTSVLGHRRRAGGGDARLALSEDERARLLAQHDTTAAAHHYRLHDDLHQHFDQVHATLLLTRRHATLHHARRAPLPPARRPAPALRPGTRYSTTHSASCDTTPRPPRTTTACTTTCTSTSTRYTLLYYSLGVMRHYTTPAAHHYRLHDDLHQHFDQVHATLLLTRRHATLHHARRAPLPPARRPAPALRPGTRYSTTHSASCDTTPRPPRTTTACTTTCTSTSTRYTLLYYSLGVMRHYTTPAAHHYRLHDDLHQHFDQVHATLLLTRRHATLHHARRAPLPPARRPAPALRPGTRYSTTHSASCDTTPRPPRTTTACTTTCTSTSTRYTLLYYSLGVMRHYTTPAAHHYRLHDDLHQHFDQESWLVSVCVGWEGGVHVQSCGHHLHLRCLHAYLRALQAPQRPHNLHVERGEFLCPVCRQLANCVLPLAPRPARPATRPGTPAAQAMGKAMEDMTATAGGKLKQRYGSSPAAIFTFVASLVRTNLECELVQRGGTLQTCVAPRYKLRNECIVPLLVVAGAHSRVLASAGAGFGAAEAWRLLAPGDEAAGAAGAAVLSGAPSARPVPLLLRDPLALLMHFLLLAPPTPPYLDMEEFTCIVRVLYSLSYYQVVCQLIAGYSAEGRAALLGAPRAAEPAGLRPSLYTQVQDLLLPFLRISALLRHHLYGSELPEVSTPRQEFVRLAYYLELVTEGMEWSEWSAGRALCPDSATAARAWARQLGAAASRGQLAVRRLLRSMAVEWVQPGLLALPRDYDRLFTYYHERVCLQCGAVPKEASVCLLCGTLVCLKQPCCRQHQVAEAVQHAMECGGGTGIFLVVTSTYIIVIRGRRACLWGSLYLDDYDEEDRDLKRGKPLYLSQDRLELLQAQWLAHRFDHTKRTWVWHRDSL